MAPAVLFFLLDMLDFCWLGSVVQVMKPNLLTVASLNRNSPCSQEFSLNSWNMLILSLLSTSFIYLEKRSLGSSHLLLLRNLYIQYNANSQILPINSKLDFKLIHHKLKFVPSPPQVLCSPAEVDQSLDHDFCHFPPKQFQ